MDILHSLIYPLEIITFLLSIYFYKKNKSKEVFFIVLYLGFTLLVETIGKYTSFINDFEFLNGLKGTNFEKNYWLYNIYIPISYLFYITYFKWQLSSVNIVKILNFVSLLYILLSILYQIFLGDFFNSYSLFTLIAGTILVLISVSLYYLELLKGDNILEIKHSLPFYISIGALFFYLCASPILIYSLYYSNSNNPGFVKIYLFILSLSNFILYSSFIFGFLICVKNKFNKNTLNEK